MAVVLGAMLAVAVAGCRPSPTSEPTSEPTAEGVPGGVAQDASFRLVLVVPKLEYAADEVIEPVARLTYLGPDPSVEIFHGLPPLPWRIKQLGGPRRMDGSVEAVCTATTLDLGETLVAPFRKSGEIVDDPTRGFDVTWFKDPDLRLPSGRWRIAVTSEISVGDCGDEPHRLTAEVVVSVAP